MRIIIFITLLTMTACAPMHSYEASIQGPQGRYDIIGKRGALIKGVFPDGASIEADDRGHPDQPSALANMASVAGAALINKGAD